MTPYLESLIEESVSANKIRRKDMFGRYGSKRAIQARQLLWAKAYNHDKKKYSIPHLAIYFDKDHTTVSFGIKRAAELESARNV